MVRAPTLGEYGAIVQLSGHWLEEATPTKDELEAYFNPKYMPSVEGNPSKKLKRDIMAYRVRTKEGVATCFLTTYGNPAAVPEEMATKSGIYGSLYMEGDQVRRFVIPEIISLMGIICKCWFPRHRETTAGMLGNATATPHALIGLLNALSYLRPTWFSEGVQSVFADLMSRHMRADIMGIRETDDGFWFLPESEQCEECAPTQKFRCIQPLTLHTPMQTIVLQVEAGIHIQQMLQLSCGKSAPPILEVCINGHGHMQFPLHEGAKMPDIPFKLKTVGPMCFWPSEISAMQCDWPIAVFLSPLMLVVMKRDPAIYPGEVETVLPECVPGGCSDAMCFDLFARSVDVSLQCRNVMLYLEVRDDVKMTIPSGIAFCAERKMFLCHYHYER